MAYLLGNLEINSNSKSSTLSGAHLFPLVFLEYLIWWKIFFIKTFFDFASPTNSQALV